MDAEGCGRSAQGWKARDTLGDSLGSVPGLHRPPRGFLCPEAVAEAQDKEGAIWPQPQEGAQLHWHLAWGQGMAGSRATSCRKPPGLASVLVLWGLA